MIWHSETLENIAAELQTDLEQGLSNAEAEARLQTEGYNLQSSGEIGSLGRYFAEQLKKGWNVTLLVCAAILFIVSLTNKGQGWHISVLMAVVLCLYCLFGAWQRQEADRGVEKLSKATAPQARVLREGQPQMILASHIVPGDLLLLQTGDYIPADGRLIWAEVLRCDQSVLLGETVPVEKIHNAAVEVIAGIHERQNMVYSGCYVASGRALAVVTETGDETESGRRAQIEALDQEDDRFLASSLKKTARTLGIFLPVLCGLLLLVGLVSGAIRGADLTGSLFDTLTLCASLAVSALPLELTVLCALAVAVGLSRFEESKSVLKTPAATEALARTTVLCTDKTGTLTQKRMSAVRVYDGNELYDLNGGPLQGNVATVLRLGAICGNATVKMQEGKAVRSGDDTEAALCSAALQYMQMDADALSNTYPRLGCVPFSSERMRMTTVNMIDGRVFAIVKGAPEAVLPLCQQNTEAAEKIAQAMAEDALRVLAVAVKPLDEAPAIPTEALEQELNFVGLVGFMDPPRKEAYEAIKVCQSAGIRVVMITGDHSATALAVAKKLGICPPDGGLLTGEEIAELSDEELQTAAQEVNLFARVSAAEKPRILAALRQEGATVTALGKTVEDAYALRQADVGCALRSAANVTCATADVVLQSDNFNAAVMAVYNSRGVFANFKKQARYLWTCGVAVFVAALLGIGIFGAAPLTALQILFAHLCLAALSVYALGLEPSEPVCMTLPPVQKGESLFKKDFWMEVAWQGGLLGFCALLAYGFGGSATAFAVLAVGEALLALSLRRSGSVLNGSFISNPLLLYCVGCVLAVVLMLTATPLGGILGLSGRLAWAFLPLGLAPFVAAEVYKILAPVLKKK